MIVFNLSCDGMYIHPIILLSSRFESHLTFSIISICYILLESTRTMMFDIGGWSFQALLNSPLPNENR